MFNTFNTVLITDESGLSIPCPAPKLSKTPGVSHVSGHRRPDIGQHTAEVLKEFKFSEIEIADFVSEGTVTVCEPIQNKSKL
jgi:alpha-methylacyl-CoA racemase